MKVYELMKLLADMLSGADVCCLAALTISELKSGTLLDEGTKRSEELYCVSKVIVDADYDGHKVLLSI